MSALRLVSGLLLVSVTWHLTAAAEAVAGVSGPTWDIQAPSRASLIGTEAVVVPQSVSIGAGAPPKDWKTLADVALPTISIAFDEFIELEQAAPASGTFAPATGIMTLSLPVKLTDSSAGTATFTVQLTTESTNGTGPDGVPACFNQPSDPSYCKGTRRDAISGALRLVAIAKVPDSGTVVDGQLLFLELNGVILGTDTDSDGEADFVDNCITISNPAQQDLDTDGVGDVCDTCTDRDADGFGSPAYVSCPRGAVLDCNDNQATVFPNAPEICDTLDNDCDVTIDEALCQDFDVDGDNAVDGAELAWLSRAFGLCSPTPQWWSTVDYDGDGCIDGADLSVLSSVWACNLGPICE